MTYLIRYAIVESNFIKSLILQHFVVYGIPNLNSLQFKFMGFWEGLLLMGEVPFLMGFFCRKGAGAVAEAGKI